MAINQRVRDNIPTVFLPPHDVLVPGANNDNPSDEHDIEYNRLCNEIIIAKIGEIKVRNEAALADPERVKHLEAAGILDAYKTPMIRTRYPKDDNESEDVVTLDDDGNIQIVDAGSR